MFSRLSLWSESTEHNQFDFCTLPRLLACNSRPRDTPCKLYTNTCPALSPERASLYLDVTGYAPQTTLMLKLEALYSKLAGSPNGRNYY